MTFGTLTLEVDGQAAVTLLQWIARQTWGAAFLATLPVAGVDGTLENRMKNSAATGLVQAKTGAEDHTRGLSGYATTRGGDYLVFSIFVNNNVQHGADATETDRDVFGLEQAHRNRSDRA